MIPDRPRSRDLVAGPWGARFRGRNFACALGRGKVTTRKREGDGATPAGFHRFVGLLYRPDRIARAQLPDWAVPVGPQDLWSDDPRDPDYNRYLPRMNGKTHFSAERLARGDPLYDIILLTDWNWPEGIPGRGSAIFVHTWRKPRHPTEGCVAFSRQDLLWIVNRLRKGDGLWVSHQVLTRSPKMAEPTRT